MWSRSGIPWGFTSARRTSSSLTYSVKNDQKQKCSGELCESQSEDEGSGIQTADPVGRLQPVLLRSMSSIAGCLTSFSCWNSTASDDAADHEVAKPILCFEQVSKCCEVSTVQPGSRSLFGCVPVDAILTFWNCMPTSGIAVEEIKTALENVTDEHFTWLNNVEEDQNNVASTIENQLRKTWGVGVDNIEAKLKCVTNDQLRVIQAHPLEDEECISTFSNQVGADASGFIAVQHNDQNVDVDIESVASSPEITVNLCDRPGEPRAAQLGGLSLLGYKQVVFSICPALPAVVYEV